MDLAGLGERDQITIPPPVLKRLGLEGEVLLTAETTADGAIVRRQAVLVLVDIDSEECNEEFEDLGDAGSAPDLCAAERADAATG